MDKVDSALAIWRFNHKCRTMPAGKVLRTEMLAPAMVHWSPDNWRTVHDTNTVDTGLGIHFADLPTDKLPTGSKVLFTFLWTESGQWQGEDFEVTVDGGAIL
jgi:glucoamylase